MIEVIKPGYYTSLQDQGRRGYRHLGVPLAGPMDAKAYALAMALLPYQNDSSVFECTLIGPSLRLHQPLRFVLTGGTMEASLNDRPLVMNRVYVAEKGSELSLGKSTEGIRTYLRFEAELKVEKTLGSVACFSPITTQNQLRKGDVFKLNSSPEQLQTNPVHLKVDTAYLHQNRVEVIPGPDWSFLSKKQQQQLLSEQHQVVSHSRMGYRLSTSLNVKADQLLSQLVLPGMVQLTPGGELLVATADCQVTGGYLQVLQFTETSLACLVQKREGDLLTFQNTLQ